MSALHTRRRSRYRLIAAALIVAALFWLVESVVDAIFFHPDCLVPRLFPIGDPGELWMRWLMVAALLLFGLYAQRLLTRRRRAEQALHTSHEMGAVVLRSIGDAVIATDTEGRVTFENPIAEALTGWPADKALGQPVDRIFNIVNERTRQPAENPLHRVTREGVVLGLANHTVLIARDGTERPIADSGAPVWSPEGRIAGAVLVFRDVTKERHAQQEIASLARFPSENPNPVLRLAGDGTILYGNARAAKLLDVWGSGVGRPAPETWRNRVREALHDRKPRMVEELVDDRSFAFVLAPVPEADYANLYGRDVTDRRRAEDRVRHLNTVLRGVRNVNQLIARESDRRRLLQGSCDLLVEARGYLGAWIVLLDADGKAAAVAEAGVGPAAFEPFADRLRREPRPPCIQRALDHPRVAFVSDPRATCGDCPLVGRYPAQSVVSACLVHGATVYGVLCVAMEAAHAPDAEEQALVRELADDIAFALQNIGLTEQHRRDEAALRRSEEKYRFLVENATDMIYTLDRQGCFTYVNPALCNALGYAAEELAGTYSGDVIADEDREKTREAFRRRLGGDGVPPYEFRVKRRDGGLLDVEIAASVIRSDEGRITGMHAILRDVTARKRAEAERTRLITAIEQAGEAVIITEPDQSIRYVNAAFEQMLGYRREEVLGRRPADLVVFAHDREAYQAVYNGVGRGHAWSGRITNRRRDGAPVQTVTTFTPVRSPDGSIANCVAVKRDVTRETRLEEQLRQASKMEAIGQLAGGIAHDFNNLLTGILGQVNLLRLSADPDSPVSDGLKTIERAAEQAAELTQQLLGFARRGKHQTIPVDLHQTVADVAAVLSRTIDPQIAVIQELRARPAVVQGDPVQMQQVILNLGINARDAMPDGGTLTITTARAELSEEALQARPGALPGPYVVLSVKDTGVGIPNAIRDRIFEPFFTSKQPGSGTGMGLATVYGIVTNHGGWVDVASEVGRGATFTVYLPAAGAPSAPHAEGAPGNVLRGSGCVLLVDDEAVVRDTASRMLRYLGYRAVTAADGREALDYYRAYSPEVDLVILDLVMPQMGGRECFRRLKEINPDVRVVLSTGYGLDGTAQAALDEGMAGFVQKPYRISQLSQVVAAALRKSDRRSAISDQQEGISDQ